ncbi:MAG: hypothetical protein KF753_12970 [Caldilineaceae bacterium]|nr:hypothetical protein [Caldilineaceae bacterium]
MSDAIPAWQVLLIGGGSATGKSTVAQSLVKKIGISHLLVDDLRIAVQAVTTPAQMPALHYFLTVEDATALSAEAFTDGLIGVGQALIPALREVISHHVAVPAVGRVIVEGDGILPEFVNNLALADVNGRALMDVETKVRAVFIYEEEEEQLLGNFTARSRGSEHAPSTEQRRYVHSIWQFGQRVKADAERFGQPVVCARPFDTLAQRILAAAG